MVRERLTADEVREVEEDTHLVVDLHEDAYWQQGEGTVEYVKEHDSGAVTVGMTPLSGPQHMCRLTVPADAREGLTYTGAAQGAKNLRVSGVYVRQRS